MFFAPPTLRRRRPQVTPLHSAPPPLCATTQLEEDEMGNVTSEQIGQLGAIATQVLSNTGNAQAVNFHGLIQPVTQWLASTGAASSSAARGKKKLQCRWCLETFEKRFNMVRHEARKHAAELEQFQQDEDNKAVLDSSAPSSGQKRNSSELETDAVQHEDDSPAASHRYKQARISEEATEDAPEPNDECPCFEASMEAASSSAETLSISTEPEAESSDRVIQMKIAAALDDIQEREDHDALESGNLFDEATRNELELADAHISACCLPFLSWLCAPAVTESERLVKARRVDPKQLAPMKKNLAFLIKSLLGTKIVEPNQLKLDVFTQKAVCEQLNTFLEERQAGASRIYALFLLIKKILVFLASSESMRLREYITPNTWNSWTVVDIICSDSNTRRKQISQNRKLLGAQQCQNLAPAPPRAIPTAADLKMPALYGEKKQSKPTATPPSNLQTAFATAVAAAGANGTGESTALQLRADANELTPEELRQIAQGCLTFLNQEDAHESSLFLPYLVTASLCFAMAPRQQVLRQLQLGSSFIKKDDGRYHVIMLAHMNKNSKATAFPIGQELTSVFDLYLGTVRPRMLGNHVHNYVFCKRTGEAPGEKFDYSDWTRKVSKDLIGRPVNCHAFRSAVVTTYYKSGASQCEMNALADVMAHDPQTARDYYFKDDAQKQAAEIQERMRQAYGLNTDNEGAGSSAAAVAPSSPALVQQLAIAESVQATENQISSTQMDVQPMVTQE